MGVKHHHPRGRERVQAMDAKGLYKGFRVIPFLLPSSPWPREATVCLVHFVLWAAIGDGYCASVEQGAGSGERGFLILIFIISDNHGEGDLLPWP
jgi:hypothetical protein